MRTAQLGLEPCIYILKKIINIKNNKAFPNEYEILKYVLNITRIQKVLMMSLDIYVRVYGEALPALPAHSREQRTV